MPANFERQIEEIFGTTDLTQLRKIAQRAAGNETDMRRNPRGAGRKARFTPEQEAQLVALRQQGLSVQALAQKFGTSRQTIYQYLNHAHQFSEDPDVTMRLNYMNGAQLCTMIDVDFKHEQIQIKNFTDKIPLRAFGVVANPSWKDFQLFLQERCLPQSRAGLKWVLQDMGIPFFDPLLIVEKTQGRMAGDDQWIQMIKKPAS